MERLPISGYVLVGGKSSRMGQDKATTLFRGRPMVALALQTLRAVCAEVYLSGNRDDLAAYANVVPELRDEAGPAAGIEAALRHASTKWVMLMPVDLPLMSAQLLRKWAERVLVSEGVLASYLECDGEWHPALCLVRRECLPLFEQALDADDCKLTRIFKGLGDGLLVLEASEILADIGNCFRNVNTPEELSAAELVAYSEGGGAARG